MNGYLSVIPKPRWQDVIDVLFVAYVIYRIALLIRGTRTMQMVVGLAMVAAAFVGSQMLGLFTLNWILDNFLGSIILVVIVVFQSDIRRALTQVGTTPLFGGADRLERGQALEEITKAAVAMASKRIGALIVLEREVGLNDYIEVGTPLDARVTAELVESVFLPRSPIHDGALVIRNGRIAAARCILPLSEDWRLGRDFGTRHRAAVGLTEGTDAVVIVVSEEKGQVSLVVAGKVTRDVDALELRAALERLLST
jgi:diadenylate cyclase